MAVMVHQAGRGFQWIDSGKAFPFQQRPVVIIIINVFPVVHDDQLFFERIDDVIGNQEMLITGDPAKEFAGAVEMKKLAVAYQEQFIPVALDLCGMFQPAVGCCFQRNGDHFVGNV